MARWETGFPALVRVDRIPKDTIDPMLTAFQGDGIEMMFEIVKDCAHSDPRGRPEMREVVSRLKAVTAPFSRVSPLWWAELEVLTMESA